MQDSYVRVAKMCADRLRSWDEQKSANDKLQAKTTAGGGLLTLLGGVAAHPAVKTVVMGLGLSTATSNGQGVSGGVASFFGGRSQSDQTEVERVRSAWRDFNTKYAAISPASDPMTLQRSQLQASVTADCLGLYVPPQGGAGNGSTTPNSGATPAPNNGAPAPSGGNVTGGAATGGGAGGGSSGTGSGAATPNH